MRSSGTSPVVLLYTAVVLAALVASSNGQEGLRTLTRPRLGALEPTGSFESAFYFDRNVGGQSSHMRFAEHRFAALVPIAQDEGEELSLSASFDALDFDTDAILPDTCEAFPDHLWDVRVGGTYRRALANGWIAGGHVSVGSPSDRPFASADEVLVTATGLTRIPHGERGAWLLMLHYANARDWLAHVPLPGVAYEYRPNDELLATLGVPFSSIRYSPIPALTFEGSYVLPRRVSTKVTYAVDERLKLHAGFDWTSRSYFRHDRDDDDDRLTHYQKRVEAGVRMDITDKLRFDVTGGFAFDRFWFEGEDYSDRGDNRLDIGDGPFVAASVRVSF